MRIIIKPRLHFWIRTCHRQGFKLLVIDQAMPRIRCWHLFHYSLEEQNTKHCRSQQQAEQDSRSAEHVPVHHVCLSCRLRRLALLTSLRSVKLFVVETFLPLGPKWAHPSAARGLARLTPERGFKLFVV